MKKKLSELIFFWRLLLALVLLILSPIIFIVGIIAGVCIFLYIIVMIVCGKGQLILGKEDEEEKDAKEKCNFKIDYYK